MLHWNPADLCEVIIYCAYGSMVPLPFGKPGMSFDLTTGVTIHSLISFVGDWNTIFKTTEILDVEDVLD